MNPQNHITSVIHGSGINDRRKLPDELISYYKRELIQAHIMFRHGARHSMSEHLLEDKENNKIKASNKGQLSEVGMRQLYLLGQSIRNEYVHNFKLLSETYDRTEIHIQSSNRTRALESAQCFMFGLYPLGTGKSIPNYIDKNLTQPPNTSSRKTSFEKVVDQPNHKSSDGSASAAAAEAKPFISEQNSQEQLKNISLGPAEKLIEMQSQIALDDEAQSSLHSSPREEPLVGLIGLEPEVQNFLRRGSKEDINLIPQIPVAANIHEDIEFKNNYSLPEGLYPFPIQTYGDHDQLLNPYIPNKTSIIVQQLKQNVSQIQMQIQKYAENIADISKKLHLKPTQNNNILSIKKLYDIITCQKYLGHDYGVSEQEYKLLMYLKSHNRLLELYTPNYSWVVSSPLLEFVFEHFDKSLKGQTNHKLVVSSTHDSQIVPLLVVLGLISPEGLKRDYENGESNFERYPPFAANFAFELYKVYSINGDTKPRYEISIKYNGNYITLNDQRTLCVDYRSFKDTIYSKIASDENYYNFCGIEKKQQFLGKANRVIKGTKPKNHFTKTNIFLLGVVIAQGIGIYSLYKLYKNKLL